jgi:hypothetical protein
MTHGAWALKEDAGGGSRRYRAVTRWRCRVRRKWCVKKESNGFV